MILFNTFRIIWKLCSPTCNARARGRRRELPNKKGRGSSSSLLWFEISILVPLRVIMTRISTNWDLWSLLGYTTTQSSRYKINNNRVWRLCKNTNKIGKPKQEWPVIDWSLLGVKFQHYHAHNFTIQVPFRGHFQIFRRGPPPLL